MVHWGAAGRAAVLALALLSGVGAAGYGGDARASTLEDARRAYHSGDYNYAYAVFTRLAEAGSADAMFWLGTMWYHGRGQPRSFQEALAWYQRAAYEGSAQAQNNLGLMHRKGQGVPASPMVAYAWFSLAASQDNAVATDNLRRLVEDSGITQEQILEGQQLTSEFADRIARRRSQRMAELEAQEQAQAQRTASALAQAPPAVVGPADLFVRPPLRPDPATRTVVEASRPNPGMEKVALQAIPGGPDWLPRAKPMGAAPLQGPKPAPPFRQPTAKPAAGPGRLLPSTSPASFTFLGQPVFLVQVGLFQDRSNVARIRAELEAQRLVPRIDQVDIGGKRYQRVRLGPYQRADAAAEVARLVDGLFDLQSAVVPVLN